LKGRKAWGDNRKLQVQLIHADKLVTIGEIATGVAYELNKPLGNIKAALASE